MNIQSAGRGHLLAPMLQPIANKAARASRRRLTAKAVLSGRKEMAQKIRPIVDIDQNIDEI